MAHVLEEVRNRRFPTPEETQDILDLAKALLQDVQGAISSTEEAKGVTPMLVGSVAKGTFLKEPDIDMFLRFPKGTEFNTIEELGLEIARKVLPEGVEKYAQHPYIAGEFRGLMADIVPCIEIEPGDKVVSAVDRTPLHCEFVMKSLTDEQLDEVRYIKAFTKGIGVYGANEEFQGLSGYLCELLLVHYHDLNGILEAAQNWEQGERIVLADSVDAGLMYESPLVFIDPTDSKRNVAQAVSKESFEAFIQASKEFLEEPMMTFFFPNEPQLLDKDKIRDHLLEHQVIGVSLRLPKDLLRDHLFGQVRKSTRSLERVFIRNDIEISRARFFITDAIYILLAYPKDAFEREILHGGPPEDDQINAQNFIEKWKGNPKAIGETFVQDGFYKVRRSPMHPSPKELIDKNGESISWGKDLKELVPGMELGIGKQVGDWNEGMIISAFIQDKPPWRY